MIGRAFVTVIRDEPCILGSEVSPYIFGKAKGERTHCSFSGTSSGFDHRLCSGPSTLHLTLSSPPSLGPCVLHKQVYTDHLALKTLLGRSSGLGFRDLVGFSCPSWV